MSALGTLALSTGMSVAGSAAEQIGYGLGELTGYNDKLKKDQLEQQQALTDMQSKANLGLMKDSYKEQLNMWNKTNAEAQIAHYKAAGLNPALMYAKGGAGGSTGSGSASVGGGNASDETSRKMANIQSAGMGLQMQKAASEIAVNQATANKLNAEAETTNKNRDNVIEETFQRGKSTWIENVRKEFEDNQQGDKEQGQGDKNERYGVHMIAPNALFTQSKVAAVTQAMAQANNAEASALLNNNKAMGYWQELLNETNKSNAAGIQAAAQKLASEWNTGEFINWKTWAELGKTVVETAAKAMK
jgi:hypothetical protein